MRYLLVLLAACANLPHQEPKLRELPDRLSTVVTVLSECDGIEDATARGTGVLISDRHVLTAAHVVGCSDIPTVHIYLPNGDRYKMVVTRENDKQDIAKLEIMSARNFELNIVPPVISPAYYPSSEYDGVCAYTTHTDLCGPRLGPNTFAGRLLPGDSGSPIYDEKYLVGLVTRDDSFNNDTIFTIITPDWMEGT